jgi:YARHG domain
MKNGISRFVLRSALLAPLLAALTPGLASADCYDVFGCSDRNAFRLNDLASGPNCDFLYTMRNAIYRAHGYCFKTARAIATFSNDGCTIDNVNRLGLSAIERNDAALIAKAESIKGCSP